MRDVNTAGGSKGFRSVHRAGGAVRRRVTATCTGARKAARGHRAPRRDRSPADT